MGRSTVTDLASVPLRRVAIVGAGVAGLSCAEALVSAGVGVALFDKGRRPGGRLSTRRIEVGGQTFSFDHGAQYFTARDEAFLAKTLEWERAGLAARWPAAGDDAWVGTPGMDAPALAMAKAQDVARESRIEAIEREGDGWRLAGAPSGAPRFDAVVIAVPAEQVAPLLGPHRADFAQIAAATRAEPCWTAMAAFAEPIGASRSLVRREGAIGWAVRDADKPGRAAAETWVVQASSGWSTQRLEEPKEAVAEALMGALSEELGRALPPPLYLSAHRWRFARSGSAVGEGALWSAGDGIGVCGDWLVAPRVEGAWLSGRRLAAMMVG